MKPAAAAVAVVAQSPAQGMIEADHLETGACSGGGARRRMIPWRSICRSQIHFALRDANAQLAENNVGARWRSNRRHGTTADVVRQPRWLAN
jgi:hypothetical protein